jgi:low temperature requirement protein LtrA
MSRFQRRLAPGGEQRTTTLELFYDLVFVFAVTQISDLLKHELNWPGLGKAVVILLVVWWAWNYTTWVMNELDPGSTVVRGLLIALTLLSLLIAVAIPDAFGSRALLFVCSYVALMVGRNLFLVLVSDRGSAERERADRVLTWLVAAGVLWVAGGLATGPARVGLWLAALAVDYAAPLFLYRVPRRPALGPRAWEIATGHFSDRFQLFVIIALGESIVVTGATAARLDLSGTRMVAFSVAFLAAAAMWWLYFSYVAGIAERRLELAKDRTRVARDAYTYLHVVIVGGVIVAAVGDAPVIAHPTAQLSSPELAAVVSGAALYLLGLSLFRLRLAGSLPPKRLLGAVGCGVAGIIGAVAPAIVVSALVVAALAGVIVAEEQAARRRRARGEPSPLEQLEATAESSS